MLKPCNQLFFGHWLNLMGGGCESTRRSKMLKALGAMLLTLTLFAGAALAADVQLAWDANDPAPDGYRMFQRLESAAYDYTAPIWQGAENLMTATGLQENTTYCWVVRAYVGASESGDSNEVCATIEAPPERLVYPKRPKTLIIEFE
jgi:hypothetical protein